MTGVTTPDNLPQEGKKIDGKIAPSLFTMPTIWDGGLDNPRSLPLRNWMCGRAFDLPWGQRIVAVMKAKHMLSMTSHNVPFRDGPIGPSFLVATR